jgi:hypothetical protein
MSASGGLVFLIQPRPRADAVAWIYADACPEIVIHLAAVVGANRASQGRWPPHDGQPAGDGLRLRASGLVDRIRLRSERGYSPGRGGIAT